MNTPIPMIKVEFEQMRHVFRAAFTDQMLKLDEMFNLALKEATAPERIQSIMNHLAENAITEAVQDEVFAFFRHGPGKKVIAEEVLRKLNSTSLK